MFLGKIIKFSKIKQEVVFFLYKSLISDLTEDSWILTSTSAFNLLRYVALIEVYEENSASDKQVEKGGVF